MKLTNNSIFTTAQQQSKPLAESFKGIEKGLRAVLINYSVLQLSGKETDKEILQKIDAFLHEHSHVITLQKERQDLLFSRAVLMVDKAIREGVITSESRLDIIELAAKKYETTKDTIYKRYQTQLQLTPLLKLTWDELYKQNKLEHLQKLSFNYFALKYKERFGKEYPMPKLTNKNNQAQNNYKPLAYSLVTGEVPSSELQQLLSLSGRELHKTDKLERLKELSLTDFQQKYKQAFGINYNG